jgi:hypothetical protein
MRGESHFVVEAWILENNLNWVLNEVVIVSVTCTFDNKIKSFLLRHHVFTIHIAYESGVTS